LSGPSPGERETCVVLPEQHASAPTLLIGIVGFTPILDSYPLGPKLMSSLEARLAGRARIAVENMTWSPIHVVQRFQDEGAIRPGRLVLVGAAAACARPGAVRAFRWMGGRLPDAVIQERIYEAVTGIVDLENTLVIGAYFEAWPEEAYTVEIDLPADTFGRMVIADSEGWASDEALAAHLGFSPSSAIAALVEAAAALAIDGAAAQIPVEPKWAGGLVQVEPFARTHVAR
jgi:hypothetical protein